MLVLIDNYDSFTWNLVHYFGRLGPEVRVFRNDQTTPQAILELNPAGIVLSPGPCDPDRAGICLAMIDKAAERKLPLLGVCLGHQAIGQAFGGKVVRAPQPLHGKLSRIHHNGESVFAGLPQDFLATRYHSLTVDPATVPNTLTVTARSEDGVIMGLAHRDLPIQGVQFHPESIASQYGYMMLANFVRYCGLPVDETAVQEQAA
ncbi:MAG TPA: aminodeoxychorismate/anthranilate synthase component II [Ferrovibrio sp.]|uniref:anthranilate synthase component II n=1 Tax=Ferrovibrio sp. TaxID=1917215 RepID=UPI002ED1980B